MEGINKCSNGHLYRKDLESCPFCSSDNTENMKDSNEVMPNENLKTDIVLKFKSFTTKILDKIKNTSFEEGSFFSFLKNKTFYFHFTIASVICLLFFYFLLLFLNTYTLNSEEFELKDYQGLSVDEIKSEFENNDLVFEIMDSIYTDSVPKGTVYSQQPSSGTFVKEGRKIYLTINCNSSQKFSIPDVYNKSEREAKIQLKSYFKVESVYSVQYSDIYSVVTNMKVANKEGVVTPFLRPAAYDDNASIHEATIVALDQSERYFGKFDIVVQLMPNCPLRTLKTLKYNIILIFIFILYHQ